VDLFGFEEKIEMLVIVLFFAVGLFLCLSLSAALDTSYLHGVPQNQYNALEDFYNATNGPYWRWDIVLTRLNFTTWNFTRYANPCADNWQGVFCDCTSSTQNRCTVVKISLAGYNLRGTIPTSFGAFTDLVQLTLEDNRITDPFPDSFQHLQNLSLLDMGSNRFTKFPDAVSLCTSLTYLDFSHNSLSNTLPSSISHLSSVSKLYLNNNRMNGTLPLGLWNLTQLMELHLYFNHFTGTISDHISQLTHLRRFIVSYNRFFGSIPESFPVSKLDYIHLAGNYFSNTIPASFQNAHLLEALYLFSNGFTGTFHLGNNIPNLVDIQINTNFFRGNLTYMERFNEIAFLFINENMFTNALPLSNWTLLLEYETSNNYFTGVFPTRYSNLSYLDEFNIGGNFLTGSLATSTTLFGRLLAGFNASYNLFTGSIPVIGANNKRISVYYPRNNTRNYARFENLSVLLMNTTLTQADSSLQTLLLNNNFFTGPLPDVICLFSQLSLISFSNNQLTGPIPFNYSLLNVANQFTVGNNKLNGPISSAFSVFNSSKNLNVFDLSENEFTGTIPEAATTDFYEVNAKALQVLNFGINCLTGTLPEALCQLSNLRTLILDGLTSSPSCILYLFPAISGLNSFIHKNKISGTLPSCLLEIPGLQTLHSSGNGITGNLPSSVNVTSSLDDLCLSHNELTGSIPLSIQQKINWKTLELSYNRLSGTLSPSFYPFPNNDSSSDVTLSLQINHLSGNIPSSLLTTSSVSVISSLSILEGNLFNCKNDKAKNLPNNDEHYQNYDCASSTSDLMIVLSSLLVVFCLFWLFIVRLPWRNTITLKLQEFIQQIHDWKDSFNNTTAAIGSSSSFYLLKDYLSNMIRLILLMMFFAITIAQPIWIGISSLYGTYEYQYLWSVAAIFMSGQTPAILLLMVFLIWFYLFFYSIEARFMIPSSASSSNKDNNLSKEPAQLTNSFLTYFVYFLVIVSDASVMLGLDVIFVVSTLNVSSNILIVISMVIAVLRVLINNVLVWKLVPACSKIVERIYLKSTWQTSLTLLRRNETEQDQKEEKEEVTKEEMNDDDVKFSSEEEETRIKEIHLIQFINEESLIGKILILNNILYPVLAVIIILPDCFYYAFVQPPAVTSSFSYLSCTVYSFTVCFPISIQPVTETASYIPPFSYTYLCAANIITYYISLFFLSFFFSAIGIPILKLFLKFMYDRIILKFDEKEGKNEIQTITTKKAGMKQLSTLQTVVLLLVPNRFRHYHPQKERPQIIDFSFCGRSYEYNLKSLPISNWKKFVCQMNGDLTVLFSFGILFPPLMIFGGICLIGIIYFEFLTLGKVLYETRQLNYLWYEKELLNESQNLMNVFRSNMYWAICISCLLLGFNVFDTWGAEEGWQYGSIGFLTLIVVPICSFCLYSCFQKKLKQQRRKRTTTTDGIEVTVLTELQDRKSQEPPVTVVENPLCDNI
jgi:hypothetical protein